MKGDKGPEILAYLHSFDPGGVERTALRLCAAWQADGARVKVLSRLRSATIRKRPRYFGGRPLVSATACRIMDGAIGTGRSPTGGKNESQSRDPG